VSTTFQLDCVDRTNVDARLARVGTGTLTRAATATFLASDCGADQVRNELAFAGIRASVCSVVPAAAHGMRPAICFDLVPLRDRTDAIDVVEFRPIALSDASAALMRERHPWWRTSRAARDACRRLLHDEDAVFGWRRVVWAPIASLRAARAFARLRPVVFDRAAIERQPWRWAYASERALEHWAFA
jgi:hypothetical protein